MRRRRAAGALGVTAVSAALVLVGLAVGAREGGRAPGAPSPSPATAAHRHEATVPGPAPPAPTPSPAPRVPEVASGGAAPMGAFLGSGPEALGRMTEFQKWLDGPTLRVGHTYLPGDLWVNIEGRPEFLRAWTNWRRADPARLLVLNVPLLERNEANVPDDEVRALLRRGADGEFDHHFRTLARRLVRLGAPDTVIVLGWEMNGVTYTGRCAPDPTAWREYWRRVVGAMRSVPGQRLRFDFAPSRGEDAIGWTACYPGDDVVDILGMDTYDQPPGEDFADYVDQPYGLRHQVEFASAHGKPVSYPEWGLFRNGDNPDFVRGMLEWMAEHPPVYQTITDYCPHGVWECGRSPRSAEAFRDALAAPPDDGPTPGPAASSPAPRPSAAPAAPTVPARPATPAASGGSAARSAPAPRPASGTAPGS
ncbi:glycoside hydrolase family 26 protein [Streptomyces sp. NPDC057702]|uniref:glycoside hydrolase family 26 protein n=1 Tax=unclassified Streptomyces TaxID=2593676 RepID=UPI0036A4119E